MTRHSTSRLIRNVAQFHAPLVEPPSDELEQHALHEFGDSDEPAIRAIFYARRRAQVLTFPVGPGIAALHGLSQRAMTRAMNRLEGRLFETVYKERGGHWGIQLLPDWENPEALAGDVALRFRKAFTETAIANGDVKPGIENPYSLSPGIMLSPMVLAALQRILDPPPEP